ncbi:MAG: hypothetical protein EZS28_000266 [Streblomastix strix]|uniref:Uncharacterized protein n=1 Tax=Streblomastix strix TaxID=222440 RepID=A0A5J4XAM5_9EUKA|nr:MAG: hypothetical protein EZS28_000266 [Streblomastix strix]
MGFFSGINNFGSKLITGIKNVTKCVAPALHKILSTISGPVGMIHSGIGGTLGAGANLAGAMDRLKRGGSGCGMMSNDVYQLFIDNNNALVYATNNQIVDGIASYFALKIEPNGFVEIGTVCMCDANWYNNGDIVPDQVTPANDATSLTDGTATARISAEYSRADHVHSLNITTTILPSDSTNGSVGTTNYYARNDHSHPVNITTSIHPQDSAS